MQARKGVVVFLVPFLIAVSNAEYDAPYGAGKVVKSEHHPEQHRHEGPGKSVVGVSADFPVDAGDGPAPVVSPGKSGGAVVDTGVNARHFVKGGHHGGHGVAGGVVVHKEYQHGGQSSSSFSTHGRETYKIHGLGGTRPHHVSHGGKISGSIHGHHGSDHYPGCGHQTVHHGSHVFRPVVGGGVHKGQHRVHVSIGGGLRRSGEISPETSPEGFGPGLDPRGKLNSPRI